MLAMSGSGERTRSWLQSRLWGTRPQEQAQASLRGVVSTLKSVLKKAGVDWLQADQLRVRLDLTRLDVDARAVDGVSGDAGEFLEGLDIAGEESFEDWLREERARLNDLQERSRSATSKPAVAVPQSSAQANTIAASPSSLASFSEQPALAVLPFINLTGDPAKTLLGEGMGEDIIDRLSKLKWLPIISRGSSFNSWGGELDARTIGEKLGARYILDGRLRSEFGAVTLGLSLVDAPSGQMIWTSKQALSDGSPEVLQELITGLALVLGTKIDVQEQNRALRIPQTDLNVRDLIWRGRWHLNRFTADDSKAAKAYFSKALAQEPNSPEAIIQMANAMLWDAWATRGDEAAVRKVRQMAQKAIIADFDDARGHMISGIAECFLRQPAKAEALLTTAISLNPSLFLAHGYLGSTLYLSDTPEAARQSLNFAMRLSPNDQHLFHVLGELAICHLMLGDFDAAIEAADAATLRRPSYWFAHVVKINALVKLGQAQRARDCAQELYEVSPQFGEHFIDWVPFCDRRWNRQLKDGLNQASS